MNWKKALLISVAGLFALVFFVVAAAGLLATVAIGGAAVAISESGVVQAFEEVAAGAERLEIDVAEDSVTFTNPDSGESRTITSNMISGSGRVVWNAPEVTITGTDGESRVIVPGLRSLPAAGLDEVVVPEIVITDPDSGQSRVIRPNVALRDELRAPRVVWDGDADWTFYGPEHGLRLVGGIFRGFFNLVALVLIVAGVYLLVRNRRQAQADIDVNKAEKSA